MSPSELAATAAYITRVATASLVLELEQCHGLTLSDESKARLHVGHRPVVEPIVARALEPETAIHA